jgi:hypothetical protein
MLGTTDGDQTIIITNVSSTSTLRKRVRLLMPRYLTNFAYTGFGCFLKRIFERASYDFDNGAAPSAALANLFFLPNI